MRSSAGPQVSSMSPAVEVQQRPSQQPSLGISDKAVAPWVKSVGTGERKER